eukprot:1804966-Rhodomonas_salina.3
MAVSAYSLSGTDVAYAATRRAPIHQRRSAPSLHGEINSETPCSSCTLYGKGATSRRVRIAARPPPLSPIATMRSQHSSWPHQAPTPKKSPRTDPQK